MLIVLNAVVMTLRLSVLEALDQHLFSTVFWPQSSVCDCFCYIAFRSSIVGHCIGTSENREIIVFHF